LKRILAALITVVLAFAVGNPASAQTSTPTPGPICGTGYYEQTASCVIYSGAGWSTISNAVFSGGSLGSTTTVGNSLTFRMYGTTLVIYRTIGTTGTTANFCVDAACQTISWNNGTTVNMAAASFAVDCLTVCNISITHNGSGGSGVNLDSFAIYANEPTNTPVTPLATWTAPPVYVPPTQLSMGQYILPGYGNFDDTDAGLNYVGEWSVLWGSGLDESQHWTINHFAYLTFATSARVVTLRFLAHPSYDDIEVCARSSCSVIDANSTTGDLTAELYDQGGGVERVVSFRIKKANNNSSPIYIDALELSGWGTSTPVSTWTPYPTVRAYTQIPPLTEIPQFTQIAPYTQIPPLTQYPLPETWTPFPTPEPYLTQIPYPTPLATWTEQPYGGYTPLPTWTPYLYPTPLDTWTPQAVAMVVVTIDGIVFDWNGLMTIFPTLITQVPPTPTPTETMTPSITPTPSVTPTTTPPGYVQYDLPGADGTPAATGVLYIEATAGDLANTVLLFLIAIVGTVAFTYQLMQSRKGPIE
jgi:hypothetical protein